MLKRFLFIGIVSVSLIACQKELAEKASKTQETTRFEDLKVSDSFNWSTNIDVTFNVVGIKALAHEENVLRVTSLDGKETYFIGLYNMGQDISAPLNIPQATRQVRVSFGSIVKVLLVNNGSINFTYLSL